KCKGDSLFLSLPDDADLDFGPGRHVAHHLGELTLVFDRSALKRSDDVARLDAGPRRGTVRLGFGDESALRLFKIEPLGDFGADRLNAHAEPASYHLSLVPQVGHHGAHGLGGNGKADTDRTSRRRHDRAVDADDLAGDVEGRASRVAL